MKRPAEWTSEQFAELLRLSQQFSEEEARSTMDRWQREAGDTAEVSRFVRWLSFYEPLLSGIPLIPDGYAEVVTPKKSLPMFLEVDLGHESRSVWQKKVQAYLQYAVSSSFTKQFNQPQFRTIVVANSERRMNSLRAATAALTEKIFWFTTLDAISGDGFWSPIWWRPTGDQRQPLL